MQKTDGRVVRLLTKHLTAEDQSLKQWFVAMADDEQASQIKSGESVTKVVHARKSRRVSSARA